MSLSPPTQSFDQPATHCVDLVPRNITTEKYLIEPNQVLVVNALKASEGPMNGDWNIL
jgi:hypothetical protein